MLYLVNKKHKSVQNSYKNLSKKKSKKWRKNLKLCVNVHRVFKIC